MPDIKERSEIDDKDKWDLSDLFQNDADWEIAFSGIDEFLAPLQKLKGTLGNSAEILADCIKLDDQLDRELGRIHTYAHLKSDENTADAHYMGMQDRIRSLYSQASAELSWIRPEILSIDESILTGFLETDILLEYKRAIELILRNKAHTLSPPEENLLSLVSEPLSVSSKTFSLLNNADLEFPIVKNDQGEQQRLTHGNYVLFLESKNRDTRQMAFNTMYDTYGKLKNTLAATLDGNVKKNIFYAKARKHESALKASLFADNVEQSVYDGLISAVGNHLDSFYKYVDLRKRCIAVDDLDMYDIYVPIVPEFDLHVPYEQACDWVRESVKPLGEHYLAIIDKAFSDNWIDVYENKGKRSGAYSSGSYDSNPYVLMNYQPNLNSVFTLAHELGHSLHSYLSVQNQAHIYSQYKIFVAEVASTTNEGLLFDYLMKTTDDPKLKAYLLNHKCDEIKGTIFRQTMFAEFEKLIHEKAENGVALTPDELCESYYELNAKYYGPELCADKKIALEWARIPHFYYNFYVYKYATGLSAAEQFVKNILSNDESLKENYLNFLKAGCSKDPLDILSDAGVDLRKPVVVENALRGFGDYVDQLAELI
ncbi:MAG: oligoendopeptidase F [Lentisphaeria bacterium]|nr:oligoendopeptidase F [Lentisphaeria bacterium]NQZ69652.1 oligoendopeptidase F [Lentisphaeria bacterium]